MSSSNLYKRLVSALILIPLLVVTILISSHEVFAGIIFLIILLAVWEQFQMLGRTVSEWIPCIPLLALLPLGLHIYGNSFWGAYIFLVVFYLAVYSIFKSDPEKGLTTVYEMAFAAVFIASPLGFFILIHQLPSGKKLLFFLLFTLWMVDTAAFFIGVRYGSHKLAPSLSPKKSVEGLAAGLAAGCFGGAVLSIFLLDIPPLHAGIIGLLLGLLCQLGDLFESFWKRALGKKDSGNFIPGHGGILDRIDSFLLTAPALYYTFLIFGAV